MEPIVTDNPQGNWETVLNYVYSKDGQAYIRCGDEGEGVLLTEWTRQQCILHGCDELKDFKAEELDELICECAFDHHTCPIFVLYTCASQAVHLRHRLALYESSGIMPDELRNRVSRFGTAKCLVCGHTMDMMSIDLNPPRSCYDCEHWTAYRESPGGYCTCSDSPFFTESPARPARGCREHAPRNVPKVGTKEESNNGKS